MALHPIRHDDAALHPQGERLTRRMENLLDALAERPDIVDSPELSTLVCQPGTHDKWNVKATLIVKE
jgi:hypothetical protein